MKKQLFRLPIFIIAVAFIAVACKKEHDEQVENMPDNVSSATIDEAVRLANQKYLIAEVLGGDKHESFFVLNEGLIDEYLAREEYTFPDEKVPGNTFISCLTSAELSDSQLQMVRRALLAHENRNETLIDRHRKALAIMLARAESQRNNLLRQLMAGEIGRPEFNRKMALLRTNLQNALLRLKESNAAEFSRSYRMLMNHLHNILEPRQWNAFTDCLKKLT